MLKEWIRNNLFVRNSQKLNNRRLNKNWFINNGFSEIYRKILKRTAFLQDPSFSQRLYHIYFNLPKIVCQNPLCSDIPKFVNFKIGYFQTCSRSCKQQNPSTIEKTKKTNLKKYGVGNVFQSEIIQKKIKHTNNLKYGVPYIFQAGVVKTKIKNTKLNRYGNENFNNREKNKETCLKRYGVENVFQLNSIKEKIKKTNIKNLGVEWPLQSKNVVDKRTTNFVQKHFRNVISQRIKNNVTPLFNMNEYVGTKKRKYLFRCIECENKFVGYVKDGLIPRCPRCYPLSISFPQKEIFNYVSSLYKGLVIENDRNLLKNGQLDLYIPEKKLAIEYDSFYYHSERFRDKFYHLNKTIECEKRGVQLIHVFEDEWKFRKLAVQNKINSILNNNEYLEIGKIEPIVGNSLPEYSLFNQDCSSMRIGVFSKSGDLIVTAFFSRYTLQELITKTYDPDILNELFEYLYKKFLPHKIITYIDRRWDSSNIYEKFGFEKTEEIDPVCWYFKNGYPLRLNQEFDGCEKIWDCGLIKLCLN